VQLSRVHVKIGPASAVNALSARVRLAQYKVGKQWMRTSSAPGAGGKANSSHVQSARMQASTCHLLVVATCQHHQLSTHQPSVKTSSSHLQLCRHCDVWSC
jgi:hypothetical protein